MMNWDRAGGEEERERDCAKGRGGVLYRRGYEGSPIGLKLPQGSVGPARRETIALSKGLSI